MKKKLTFTTLLLLSSILNLSHAQASADLKAKHKRAPRHKMNAARSLASHAHRRHSATSHRNHAGNPGSIGLGTFPAVVADSTR